MYNYEEYLKNGQITEVSWKPKPQHKATRRQYCFDDKNLEGVQP